MELGRSNARWLRGLLADCRWPSRYLRNGGVGVVDRGYEHYCLVDPVFYDSPYLRRPNDPDLRAAQRPVPSGWLREELGDWLAYSPDPVELPLQGWKVHVSACLDNAEDIGEAVFDYCVARQLTFKFVRSVQLLLLRNGKYADRASSGKFATIYARDVAQLQTILEGLGEKLRGQPGPYILSDLRWGDGPLYVRYGGFAERYCVGESGEQVLAIEDPTGRLVPDKRGPRFEPPSWLDLPYFLGPHLAARNAVTVDEMPYQIEEALHFSNGGGLYAGVDRRTNRPVVLKEARPHAGIALDRSDAVTRLAREHDTLQRLAGNGIVPEVLDNFSLGEHRFLVLEKVDGEPLHSAFVSRYPLIAWAPTDEEIASYTAWALDIYERVETAVDLVHDRGIVIGDLHPNNVLVKPDGGVVLLDFEASSPVSDWDRQTMADPGFMSPPDRSGFEVDRYALGCLALYLFLPLPTLMRLAPAKVGQFKRVIADAFPVPKKFLTKAVATIAPGRRPRAPSCWSVDPSCDGWLSSRASAARAIIASATPERDDRLFPGDVKQFAEGGLNIAHGASGVLYALAVTGAERREEHEQWLLRHALSPSTGTRYGFYDGLIGVAFVLDRLGRREEALKVLELSMLDLRGKWAQLGIDLYGGLAGIGLALMHFSVAMEDSSLWREVLSIADTMSGRLGSESTVAEISGEESGFAGLLRGSSGPALLFLRLFERTGDSAFLDLARTALGQDLRRCVIRDDGAMNVNEGWRSMPYLGEGSVGIGMVLDDYLMHREEEWFLDAAVRIRGAAESQFYIEPGLFYGRSGMILYLARKQPPGQGCVDPVVAGQIRRLAWHALSYKGHLAFPGEQLLRLSMDLGSGTAGVLLSLGAALHDKAVSLPFLESRGSRGVEPPRSE